MALNKKIDKSKKAKPVGLRFRGTHKQLGDKYYKHPERVLGERALHNAEAKGLVYYEPRLSKGDVNQTHRFEKDRPLGIHVINQGISAGKFGTVTLSDIRYFLITQGVCFGIDRTIMSCIRSVVDVIV